MNAGITSFSTLRAWTLHVGRICKQAARAGCHCNLSALDKLWDTSPSGLFGVFRVAGTLYRIKHDAGLINIQRISTASHSDRSRMWSLLKVYLIEPVREARFETRELAMTARLQAAITRTYDNVFAEFSKPLAHSIGRDLDDVIYECFTFVLSSMSAVPMYGLSYIVPHHSLDKLARRLWQHTITRVQDEFSSMPSRYGNLHQCELARRVRQQVLTELPAPLPQLLYSYIQ